MKIAANTYLEISAALEAKIKTKVKIKKDKTTKKNVVDAIELFNNLADFKDEKITLRTIQPANVQ